MQPRPLRLLVSVLLAAVPAAAQEISPPATAATAPATTPAPPAPAPATAREAACFPACRDGFTCYQARCVSLCNPPCPEGLGCVEGKRCEPPLPTGRGDQVYE